MKRKIPASNETGIFQNYKIKLFFVNQNPIAFFDKRNGFFVFHTLIFSAHHVLDGHLFIPSNFWPITNNSFRNFLSLCLPRSSRTCCALIQIGDFILLFAEVFLSSDLAGFLNCLFILIWQFSFKQE